MTQRTLPTQEAAPTALAHVVLRTAHIDECVEFYGKLLGMRTNTYTPGRGAALSHDREHHRIALMNVPAGEQHALGPGLEHLAFKARSIVELLGNYKRLRDKEGILPFMAIHHGGTLSAYYRDPDGVQIEIFIDTRPVDIAIEDMNSDEFRRNPIGVPIDFDDLVARFEAGESIASLFRQPELKEGDLESLVAKLMAARA
jgi:catechol 2,3-dioxygenase-like lactoylglutathione lyase family enzyme